MQPGTHVVLPGHGTGMITAEEAIPIGGVYENFLCITMTHTGVVLRVPTRKAPNQLRSLSPSAVVHATLVELTKVRRQYRGHWNKQRQIMLAQQNSQDPQKLAELVRDLFDERHHESSQRTDFYTTGLRLLSEELSAITGRTVSDVSDLIEATIADRTVLPELLERTTGP